MSPTAQAGDATRRSERVVRRALVDTSRALLRQAEAATRDIPDPWELALVLERMERLHDQLVPWFAPGAPGLAAVARRRDAVRAVVASRAQVRAGWALRPVGLLVAQASLQVARWSEQMENRALVVAPVERVDALRRGLAEIAAELDAHALRGTLSDAATSWRARIPALLAVWDDAIARARLVREQVELAPLLAVVRVELTRVERNVSRLEQVAQQRGGLRIEGQRVARSMARRLQQTQWQVASIVLAWRGAAGAQALLRCHQLLARLDALAPSPPAGG